MRKGIIVPEADTQGLPNKTRPRAERTPHRPAATLLKVVVRLRVRLTELMVTNEPTAISAAISPYSIAVTPQSSLISLASMITIDRLSAGFDHGQPPIKSLIGR